MELPERISSAIIRADFGGVIDRVKNEKRVVIITRNNIDDCAIVPLEFLEQVNGKRKKKSVA